MICLTVMLVTENYS